MHQRQVLSTRVTPETIELLNKLAVKHYGTTKKRGFIVDSAIQLFHSSDTRPVEAASILSVTEEIIIEKFDQALENMAKNTVKRIGDLIARQGYETHLISLMTEELFRIAYGEGWKSQYDLLRKEAAQRMKGKLTKADLSETAQIIEESETLRGEVERLKEENQKFREMLVQARDHIKQNAEKGEKARQKIAELSKELQNKADEIAAWKRWYHGLREHMASAGRFSSPASVLEDYIAKNGVPEAR